MAVAQETTFAVLLVADSEYILPMVDKEVQVVIAAYDLTFKRTKGEANVAFRADLLAGIAWLHLYHADLGAVLKRISADQLSRLALALGLDVAANGLLAHWPQLLATLSRSVPGSTPVTRKAANVEAEGQIKKPHAPQPDDGVDHSQAGEKEQSLDKQLKRLKSGKKAPVVSSLGGDSASGSTSASDSSSDGGVVVMETLPAELMPAQLGHGLDFDALVATTCARKWLPTDDRHNGSGYSCAISLPCSGSGSGRSRAATSTNG
jgi:hypothetical protein